MTLQMRAVLQFSSSCLKYLDASLSYSLLGISIINVKEQIV